MLEEYWVHSRATFEGFGAKLLAVYTRSAGKKRSGKALLPKPQSGVLCLRWRQERFQSSLRKSVQ